MLGVGGLKLWLGPGKGLIKKRALCVDLWKWTAGEEHSRPREQQCKGPEAGGIVPV